MKIISGTEQKSPSVSPAEPRPGIRLPVTNSDSSSPTTFIQRAGAPNPICLRRGEVAGLLQVSVWTVDRMAANGEIRKVKFGRAARFVRTEVEELLKQKLKR